MDSRILHYEFVTGESVNITVSAEIAEVIYDSRRMEHASNERSRYHTAFSLDSEDYEGTNLISEKTPDDLMEELEDREHLLDCLAHLSENQRQRILMLAQGMSITEIARVQHADRTTVRESIQAARKKFKKYLAFLKLFFKSILTKERWHDIIIERCKANAFFGGIAQLARAFGSYPEGRGFKSNFRYQPTIRSAS